jgi:hypothetical protein
MYLQIQIIAINSASLPMLAYQNYQYGDYLFFKFFYIDFFPSATITCMPKLNSFLLRAWASDPLISMSLKPKPDQIKLWMNPNTTWSTSPPRELSPKLELEDIKKPFPLIPPSLLEPEEFDLDLPSSVVEEIEVCYLIFHLVLYETYQTCNGDSDMI